MFSMEAFGAWNLEGNISCDSHNEKRCGSCRTFPKPSDELGLIKE